jgi:hypothetical protein
MPESLRALTAAGYLPPDDAIDPWGRAYAYRLDTSAYELVGKSAQGQGGDIVVRHPFTASQRMILEGGAAERGATARP